MQTTHSVLAADEQKYSMADMTAAGYARPLKIGHTLQNSRWQT